jgi:uncharacterized membrane protein YgcG
MKPTFSIRRFKRWLLASSVLPGCLVAGCHAPYQSRLDKCASIIPGSLPAPNGSFVRQHQLVQTNKAEMDDFVVYLQEWYMGGKELGPYGEYHIVQMAQRLPSVPNWPILIQVAPDPVLNEIRRRVVIEKLANCGVPDAALRVQLGRPEAEGLNGPESFRVYQGLLFNTGYNQGGGGFGGGGFGGAGFGGNIGFGGGGGGFGGGGFGGGFGGFPFPSF